MDGSEEPIGHVGVLADLACICPSMGSPLSVGDHKEDSPFQWSTLESYECVVL